MLPKRRKPKPSGIDRGPKRIWVKHEKWVRGHECCAGAPDECDGRIEFCHIRLFGDGGTGLKPPSWRGIPLCSFHHSVSHEWGQLTFDRRYGIDSKKLAAEFAAASPDTAMKQAMRDAENPPTN